MLAVRLPRNMEKRLERLAKRTDRTKTDCAREAIIERLDDLERIYLPVQTNVGYRKSNGSRTAVGARRGSGARDRS